MAFALSILISVLALVFSLLRVPILKSLRIFLVLFALGAGQIHLAFLALTLFLISELSYRFEFQISQRLFAIVGTFYVCTLFLTVLSPIDKRVLSELIQLFIYFSLFFLICAILKAPEMMVHILKMSVYASLAIACLGIFLNSIELTEVPAIFLERGGNEGSTFLLLMGVVPCIFMFLKTRNILYILISLVLVYAQFIATSRANYALSVICLSSIVFFMLNRALVRGFVILVLMILCAVNFPEIIVVWESEQNYSALQRILLYEAGFELVRERPWIGWGWGSTSRLASSSNFTDLIFPHFHSTFIQLWVELGLLGLALIVMWFLSLIWSLVRGFFGTNLNEHNAYIALSSFALFFSGFTEAMLFGADRAIQVVFLLAITINILKANKSISKRSHDAIH
jgi:O-antigen ligase